ncbi:MULTISPECIES: DUF4123 domain-containing protein [unclassified Halomonas]|uniref:DUF4123 domain-containing protein n=1 Tax=unclassified Halomonas TaxID=2609666 RepID=UPI001EF4DD6A|nr:MULTISPECIES: DUF4123 domain-containing protein [unclassified Halomonas]MCG7591829.1 DUF4123 domain-containing protein [Halomonas sp. McD50-5]MCG7617832.1 DUF4123 domain-containing protein [Halomonas sp. McD50-4]
MSRWLSQLAERTRHAQTLTGNLTAGQTAYMVLDQRRAPEQSRTLLACEGKRDFTSLFAGTALSPLLDASPWLLELSVGSAAWRHAQTLCHQRLGWVCQPAPDQTLLSLANYLQTLFVLDDPQGGKSLINLQQPSVWSALLASAPPTCYAQCSLLLGQVATPTPQSQWLLWQPGTSEEPATPTWSLTSDMETALKESQQAWWLSRMTETPLTSLPAVWLARMNTLVSAGISRSDHLKRLLPLMTDESDRRHEQLDDILHYHLPTRQKVQQLERLL